jgi:hypothetical protein
MKKMENEDGIPEAEVVKNPSVKLTEKQLDVLKEISTEKLKIQDEFAKVVKRESDVITVIAECNGIAITKNTKISVNEIGELVFEG